MYQFKLPEGYVWRADGEPMSEATIKILDELRDEADKRDPDVQGLDAYNGANLEPSFFA
jgi:hypothetical protein